METRKDFNQLSFLNPLRFVGALIIVSIFHNYLGAQSTLPIYSFFYRNGRIFVEMFFIISGLVFNLRYLHNLKSGFLTFKSFALRRFLRIYPLFLLSIFIIFLTEFFSGAYSSISISNLILSLFSNLFGDISVFGIGQRSIIIINPFSWYITVLCFCYVLACLFIAASKKHRNLEFYLFLIPIVLGISLFIFSYFCWHNFGLARGLICFFLGIYLGYFIKRLNVLKSNTQTIIKLISLLLSFAFAASLIVCERYQFITELVFTLCFGLFVFIPLFIGLYSRGINKYFSKKIYVIIGRLSYPIYILSPIVLWILKLDKIANLKALSSIIIALLSIALSCAIVFIQSALKRAKRHSLV